MPSLGTCETCDFVFKFFSLQRKVRCTDCQGQFCVNCTMRSSGPADQRRCTVCCLYRVGPAELSRPMLGRLKVKELKEYLAFLEVPCDMCCEKGELVELIVQSKLQKTGASPKCRALPRFRAPQTFNNQRTEAARLQREREEKERVERQRQQQRRVEEERRRMEEQRRLEEQAWLAEQDRLAEQERAAEQERQATIEAERARLNQQVDLSVVSEDDIHKMPVLQLKKILTVNFVDYRGCFEKRELVERVLRVWHEQHPTAPDDTTPDLPGACGLSDEKNVCKICMDARINCVLLECGHMCCCNQCGRLLAECPICRQYVVRAVHVFQS